MGNATKFERKVETVVPNFQAVFPLLRKINILKGLVTIVARMDGRLLRSKIE